MVQRGRFTAQHEGPVVVFMIGMRVNNWLKPHQWWPVFSAMGPMLAYLHRNPQSGFLGGVGPLLSPGFRQVTLIQYWRSTTDLERFAQTDPQLHPKAWKRFFAASFKGGSVGIWHETYEAQRFETVYGNMPPFGLGQASGLQAVKGNHDSMRQRLYPEKGVQP